MVEGDHDICVEVLVSVDHSRSLPKDSDRGSNLRHDTPVLHPSLINRNTRHKEYHDPYLV